MIKSQHLKFKMMNRIIPMIRVNVSNKNGKMIMYQENNLLIEKWTGLLIESHSRQRESNGFWRANLQQIL